MDDREPTRGPEPGADEALPATGSEVLYWRLGKLYAAWREGSLPVPPERWDVWDLDETAGLAFAAPRCIEFEMNGDGGERRWHLCKGEVLVYSPRFQAVINPYSLVTIENWAQWEEIWDQAAQLAE